MSGAETFDGVEAGQGLPAGWSQWSSAGAAAAFAVSQARAQSAPNGLAVSSPTASGLSARAWLDASQPADVLVSASAYLDTAIPAQVIARGSGLDTATPTYYAASASSSLLLRLVRVVDGVSTTLAQLKSADWFSARWAKVSLSVSGDSVRAQVYRPDRGLYLNASGQWQPSPAWALDVADGAISSGGLVGLGRPASYTGSVSFDDFSYTSEGDDKQAPAVAITAPSDGDTLTGVTAVQASASDNVGVARVEFYVDDVLRATRTQAPYSWDFDTSTATNGEHTLKVLAYDDAGNVGRSSLTVTTENDNPPLSPPDIPRHYSHIRIAQLAYNGGSPPYDDQLLRDSVDLVVTEPIYVEHIHDVAPDTPQLLYTNVSSVYRGLFTDWLSYADANGISREAAFYHVAAATAFAGSSPSSQPVTWFWRAYRDDGSSAAAPLLDQTWQAHGTSATGVKLPTAAGRSFYLGSADRFREINFDLISGAGGAWSAVLEYASAVDSAGNPTAWTTLSTLTDTTSGFTKSGQMTFDPPEDWKTATLLTGSPRLFYVRLRTVTAGTGAPVAHTILGRDYVGARGTTSGIIPAFDAKADTDQNGYLDDAEYAGRADGKDARFVHESRAFTYGQMRFATNPADLDFREWAIDYHQRLLDDNPHASGLFVDNSQGKPPVTADSVLEAVGSYADDYAALLYAIGRAIDPHWLMANTAGGGVSADPTVERIQSYYEEFAIRPLAHNYLHFESMAGQVARRASLKSPAPYAVLDSYPSGGSPTDPRTQLATLAYYYLLADPDTDFLNFYGGYEPASSWSRHWSPAAAYDIGTPDTDGNSAWSLFATGKDPSDSALTYRVYQRAYSNALVLYKPLSHGDNRTGTLADETATTFALDGTYRLLQADGSLGDPVTSVSLRNGEGAILVKDSA